MPGTRLVPSPFVSTAELDGETVLLDARSGRYFGLNTVGSRIWSLASENRSPAEIAEALLTEYDAPRERIFGDVERLLSLLEGRQLVIRVESDSTQEGGVESHVLAR
jgi:hypothetical protein